MWLKEAPLGKIYLTTLEIHSDLVQKYQDVIADRSNTEVPPSIVSVYKPWNDTLGEFPKGTVHLKNKIEHFAPIHVGDCLEVSVLVKDRTERNNKNYFVFESVYSRDGRIVCRQETTYLQSLGNQNKTSDKKKQTTKGFLIEDVRCDISRTYRVNQKKINQFAFLSGATADIHTNPEYAQKTIFGATLVHGLFLTGLIEKELKNIFREWSVKGCLTVTFLRPVKVDDEFSVCIEKNDSCANVAILCRNKVATWGRAEINA